MRFNRLFILTASALSLAACATTQPSMHAGHAGLGNAVKANIAAQTVAPSDEQKANTYIPANRARQKLARDAYEKGEVKEPVPMSPQGDKK